MKTSLSYAHCAIFVQGMDFKCPLCGTDVPSGTRHECSKEDPPVKKSLLKRSRGKNGHLK